MTGASKKPASEFTPLSPAEEELNMAKSITIEADGVNSWRIGCGKIVITLSSRNARSQYTIILDKKAIAEISETISGNPHDELNMSTRNDMPAFPCDLLDFQPTTGTQVVREQCSGMTLRDYFASHAISTIQTPGGSTSWEIVAEESYRLADAMLQARKSKGTE